MRCALQMGLFHSAYYLHNLFILLTTCITHQRQSSYLQEFIMTFASFKSFAFIFIRDRFGTIVSLVHGLSRNPSKLTTRESWKGRLKKHSHLIITL